MEFNRQISNVEPSKSVTLLTKTKELQKIDPEILNLTGGEPDFPTPKAICDTVVAELAAGHTHYSDSRGDAQLRARIARKLQEENHAPFQPENILITPGAKYAVYLTIRALINPGDEAIWLTPGWVSYPSIVEASGGIPVAVHLKYEENYRITAEALEAAVSDKTKLLIINYPNNPTGQILTEADIQALTVFLRKHPDIYVLSDEIYGSEADYQPCFYSGIFRSGCHRQWFFQMQCHDRMASGLSCLQYCDVSGCPEAVPAFHQLHQRLFAERCTDCHELCGRNRTDASGIRKAQESPGQRNPRDSRSGTSDSCRSFLCLGKI